ncbi:MAG: efflux transporter outer membrane subunit [Pseudomonadales bacterium]
MYNSSAVTPKMPAQPRLAVKHILLAVSLVAVSACSNLAGPDYERPEAPSKSSWQGSNAAKSETATVRADWWTNFADPYLDQLIEKALANNLDLRVLAARIGVAEATISQANAARLPTIDAALGARFQKTEGGKSTQTYSHSEALSWELDVWGKAKKGVEAQKAEFKASEADWRAGYLELVSNVASGYFQIRQFDEQLDRQNRALSENEKILTIYEAWFKEGIAPKTRVLQQQAEVSQLRNDLLELQRLRKLTEHALATLLGMPAGDMQVPTQTLSDTVQIVNVPAGLPADLLARRPDIIAAEYRVLQAHELVGQARLARLPSIGLTGNTGGTSLELSDLLKTWTFGLAPTISLPIFDPNVRSRIKVSKAQTKVVEEQYRATVVRAFEEVENSLVNLSARKQQQQQLLARRDKLRIVSEQVRAQLEEGMVTQLEVFESERSLLAAELALLQNHQQILTDTVALYKALGGGWPRDVVEQAGL